MSRCNDIASGPMYVYFFRAYIQGNGPGTIGWHKFDRSQHWEGMGYCKKGGALMSQVKKEGIQNVNPHMGFKTNVSPPQVNQSAPIARRRASSTWSASVRRSRAAHLDGEPGI